VAISKEYIEMDLEKVENPGICLEGLRKNLKNYSEHS
jgi:hypothetical protein